MTAGRRQTLVSILALALVLILAGFVGCGPSTPSVDDPAAGDTLPQGTHHARPGAVVIERIGPGSPLDQAGLLPGDVLLRWSGPAGEGAPIVHFDDSWEVEIEAASRHPVLIEVRRGEQSLRREIGAGRWQLEARPAPTRPADDPYAEAYFAWRRATGDEAADDRQLGKGEVDDGSVAVVAAWNRAARASRRAGDLGLEAWLARQRCLTEKRRSRLEAADAACARCAELRQGLEQDLLRAECLYHRGHIAGLQGRPKVEEARFRQLVDDLATTAPGSLLRIRSLHGLAKARATQDDLEQALDLGQRALALVEQQAPRGLDHQASEMILGIFHWFRSDWQMAEMRIRRSLAILQEINPEHEDVANALNNLGLVASSRGDLAAADDYYRRSLEVRERVAPNALERSRTLNNLSTLAERRGDLELAAQFQRQVLALRRELAPGSIDVATPLLNLGGLLVDTDELDEAERLLLEALELQRLHVPDSRDECSTLEALGRLYLRREDGDAARAALQQALAICSQRVPGSAHEAQVLASLAEAELAADRPVRAEAYARRAAERAARVVPGTLDHALHLHCLARSLRAQGRQDEALDAFHGAVDTLDRQLDTLGGSDEVRSGFRAQWGHLYRDLVDLLLEVHGPAAALQMLERSRSRSFLALVRARDISLLEGAPAHLVAEAHAIRADYDELLGALAVGEGGGALAVRRRELQRRRDRLAAELVRAAPRVGELGAEFGAEQARRSLPPGVVAVSYAVDDHGVRAWVLDRARGPRVVELAISGEALRDLVDRFRLLVATEASVRSGRHGPLAERLHQLLIESLGAAVVQAESLVVVPDGALHHLPFGALMARTPDGPKYLAERTSIQMAPSLSAFALLARRPPEATEQVVVFADPATADAMEAPAPGAPATASATRRALGPLPASRWEAESLRRLFGDQRVEVYVGADATEAAAKAAAPRARILHFGTHTRIDGRSPLDSALLLVPTEDTHSGRHNGWLQAWEVMQGLRLDASLVTLSACESAAGSVYGDEGILGLTRSFQFAGARGVVASLWRVPDQPTALLMERFYRGLAGGLPVHRALQEAQRELIQGSGGDPALSHPYVWAGFQLYGAAPRPDVTSDGS